MSVYNANNVLFDGTELHWFSIGQILAGLTSTTDLHKNAAFEMKFIVVLQPKGWIATIQYMYSLH